MAGIRLYRRRRFLTGTICPTHSERRRRLPGSRIIGTLLALGEPALDPDHQAGKRQSMVMPRNPVNSLGPRALFEIAAQCPRLPREPLLISWVLRPPPQTYLIHSSLGFCLTARITLALRVGGRYVRGGQRRGSDGADGRTALCQQKLFTLYSIGVKKLISGPAAVFISSLKAG